MKYFLLCETLGIFSTKFHFNVPSIPHYLSSFQICILTHRNKTLLDWNSNHLWIHLMRCRCILKSWYFFKIPHCFDNFFYNVLQCNHSLVKKVILLLYCCVTVHYAAIRKHHNRVCLQLRSKLHGFGKTSYQKVTEIFIFT